MSSPLVPGITSVIGSGLMAQRERMSLIASNMANADSITTPGGKPYRAEEPVFAAEPALSGSPVDTVGIAGVVQSNAPPRLKYDPGNPYANKAGYVQESDVNPVQQMTDLIGATQDYAAQIAVLDQSSKLGQAMLQSFIA